MLRRDISRNCAKMSQPFVFKEFSYPFFAGAKIFFGNLPFLGNKRLEKKVDRRQAYFSVRLIALFARLVGRAAGSG